MLDLENLISDFEQSLLSLDRLKARQIVQTLRTASHDAKSFQENLERTIVTSLARIGKGWEQEETALSQVYMSGCICEEIARELFQVAELEPRAKNNIAIACLKDYHTLGKHLVYSILTASGFYILDYGCGISVDDLVSRVRNDGIEILLISTLMLPSALMVRELRTKLNDTNRRIKIIVGGAPFRLDSQLWKEVGADAVCFNASDAIAIVSRMEEEMQ